VRDSWRRCACGVTRISSFEGASGYCVVFLTLVRVQGTSMDEIVINARAHLGGIKPATEKAP
jgi:hypothetical protein